MSSFSPKKVEDLDVRSHWPVSVLLLSVEGYSRKPVRSATGPGPERPQRLRHNVAVPPPVLARVVVLAGPSGVGKSRLAAQSRLPVLRLDDFYRSGDDAGLPRIADGANAGLVDWDDPRSWHVEEAVRAIGELATTGRIEAPVYDIARSAPSGVHVVDLKGSSLFVAEGIFAQEVVGACRAQGLLAAALCLRQHPLVTFWRRLTRDLREHRKPPLVLVRRGWALMLAQRRVIAQAEALGCEVVSVPEAAARIRRLEPPERRTRA
jgi:uridine kinase